MSKPVDRKLYDVLGVEPTATNEELRAAHRRKAKGTHPDRGGNPDEFKLVNDAWRVLSNPDLKARYDAGELGPDNGRADVTQAVGQEWAVLLQELFGRDASPEHTDVMTMLRGRFTAKKYEMEKKLKDLERAEAKLVRYLGRFKTKHPDNLLEAVVKRELDDVAGAKPQVAAKIKFYDEVLEFLKDYSYEFTKGPNFAPGFSATSSWSMDGPVYGTFRSK